MKIAVIGAGIAGLYAAHKLSRDHDVTVFEAADYLGGHTHTVDVDWHGQPYAIDTGFIVFNDWTYPNFIDLLDELGVASQPSKMSFSLRCEASGLEYNGTSLNTVFAQRRNALRPSFLRMLTEILRFNRESCALLKEQNNSIGLGDYLTQHRYSRTFIDHYIVPMGRAIWSAEASAMLNFPARFFVDFFERHGFLNIDNRPQWRTVLGGSREYVRKLIAALKADVRVSSPVSEVRRTGSSVTIRTTDQVETFDAIFFACHSDQALKMLADAAAHEREILLAFPYAPNEAVLHTDETVLPRRPLARAAWNYHLLREAQEPVALTYDMNVLQNIDAPVKFLVSLNYAHHIDPAKVIARFDYEHPVYLPQGVLAQARHREINGNRSYFCGAYWRNGFHEDGVVSAQQALDHFNSDLSRGAFGNAQLPLSRVG